MTIALAGNLSGTLSQRHYCANATYTNKENDGNCIAIHDKVMIIRKTMQL